LIIIFYVNLFFNFESNKKKQILKIFFTQHKDSELLGTNEYWNREYLNLEAMDEELGPATFFVTLSCAEYEWEDVERYLKAINPDWKNVTNWTTGEMNAADPVALTTHFVHRLKAFMKYVLLVSDGPLGTVEHYYYRIEDQGRGILHCHAKLWIKDAPVIHDKMTKEEIFSVAEFLKDKLSCRVPSEAKNPRLRRQVLTKQLHKCTKSCIRRRGKYARCRYGFPRPVSTVFELNSLENCVKSRYGRRKVTKLYNLPRRWNERMINDYNPCLLMFWGGNIDVQFIGFF
jgi:hypothetical protein